MNQLVSLLLYYLPIIHTALSISLSSLAHPVFSYSCFRLLSVTSKNQIEKQKFFLPTTKFATNTRDRGGSASTNTLLLLVGGGSVTLVHTTRRLLSLPRRVACCVACAFPSTNRSVSALCTLLLLPSLYSLHSLLFLCLAHGSTSSRRFYDCAAALASICFGNSSKRALIEGLRSRTNLQALASSLKIPIPAGTAGTVHSTRRELPKICTPDRFARHGVVLSEVF